MVQIILGCVGGGVKGRHRAVKAFTLNFYIAEMEAFKINTVTISPARNS